jgi:hypothetical protein
MHQDAKITKKTKARNKAQIRDLKPAKDPKGGIIAILIGLGSSSSPSPPPPPPPPPTTK